MLEHEREAEADGAAARDRDAQLLRLRLSRHCDQIGRLHRGGLNRRPQARRLEAEDLIADLDLVAGLQSPGCHGSAVDKGAVAAAPVLEHVAVSLGAKLGVQARRQRVGKDDIVLIAATKGNRTITYSEPLARELPLNPHHRCHHRLAPARPEAPHNADHHIVGRSRSQPREPLTGRAPCAYFASYDYFDERAGSDRAGARHRDR